MSNRLFIKFLVISMVWLNFMGASAVAARKGASESSSSSSGFFSSSGPTNLLMDISAHYVRDTRPNGVSDFATRFSIGGMFSTFVGLDLLGHYETKTKSYLVGADLRLMPVSWLFLKGGLGGYAVKEGRRFEIVPLAGAGIMAPVAETLYLVSEVGYFQSSTRYNISFGLGLGLRF